MLKPEYRFYDAVSSTNDIAKELIRLHNAVNGMVIKAKQQLKGRGRQGNFWESEKGENLLFSIILYPDHLQPSDQFIINCLISVSLRDFLQKIIVNTPVKIKWPNDIYVGNKKIAGILIEHTLMGDVISHTIAGIGINVNQVVYKHAPNPTSLVLETEKTYSPDQLCKEFSELFLHAFEKLKKSEKKQLAEEYIKHLFRLNETRRYLVHKTEISGIIRGVSDEGCLILEKENGKKIACELNQIEYII